MPDRIIVVADDLTGACEIAGVALRHGIQSSVTLETRPPPLPEKIQVIDSETRLSSGLEANAVLQTIGRNLAKKPRGLIFKKTDSVLRGPLRAELEALASSLGFKRILLVPSNPGLGRTVQGGRYTVHGTPLNETAFAHDPHHPAQSSHVLDLLAPTGKFIISSAPAPEALPNAGLSIGDASTVADLDNWARNVPEDTLPAGSSAFFERWLLQRRAGSATPERRPADLPAPILLISGTTIPAQRALLARAAGAEPLGIECLDSIDEWTHRIVHRLSEGGRTLAFIEGAVSREPSVAKKITEVLAHVASLAVQASMTRHLVIEGGATAAAIAAKLGWLRLETVTEWAPGIVSLQTETHPPCFVSVKPGSYPWPESFAARLFGK